MKPANSQYKLKFSKNKFALKTNPSGEITTAKYYLHLI